LQKKLKKKLINSGDSFVENYDLSKKSITLVAYRKTDDYFNDRVVISTNSSSSSTTMGSEQSDTTSISNDHQSKLSLIKADLAAKISLAPVSNKESSIKSAIESKIANSYTASASDLLFSDKPSCADDNSVSRKVNDLSADLNQVNFIVNLSNVIKKNMGVW
jgi:hypothetical protein